MSVERMQLPDGRVFEYSAAGDPGRELLVFCVGTPSAVVDFPYVADAAAARGLRSVICSRPGYGGSTRNEGRTVADAASDTAALADHLGAERFLVAGWSGGGSTALACAALLPDRVRAAVTLAGTAPPVEAGEVWTTWFPPDMADEVRALTTKPPAELAPEYEQAAKGFAELTGEQHGELGEPERRRQGRADRGARGRGVAGPIDPSRRCPPGSGAGWTMTSRGRSHGDSTWPTSACR